jgi:preprotein translocase subunit SecD
VAAVALILLGALAVGSRIWSPGGATLQAAVRFEARLAEDGPGPGLREVQLSGSRAPIYLHQEVIVSNEDVAQSRVVAADDPARFNIALQFTIAGAEKMRRATADHVGRPIAILIDGEVVMAPTLRGQISESALVTGDFTRSQAERIANGIGLR